MRVAHVRDDGDVGAHHLAEIADLAEVVHARLDDGGAVLRRQAQERQRRADVVVVIGLGLKRLEALGQHRGDHLLRRRLAGGTGDLHDREREAPAVPRSERAQGEQRVVHKNVELAGLQRSGRVHGQAARRAARKRAVEIGVAVELLADERDKQVARGGGAAVGGDVRHRRVRVLQERPTDGAADLRSGAGNHSFAAFRASRESWMIFSQRSA